MTSYGKHRHSRASGVPINSFHSVGHCNVELESVLRIRPLLRKERDDAIVLEPQLNESRNNGNELGSANVVTLNPHFASVTSPNAVNTGTTGTLSIRGRIDSDGTMYTVPTDYHFNHVLPDTTSQDKIYYTVGLPIATASMTTLKTAASSRSNNSHQPIRGHLIVCMGVINSGKTYTCFGGPSIGKRRASQDGIVPRLLDSLFSQSKHFANVAHADGGRESKGFTVEISMMQVMQPKKSHTSHPSHDTTGTGLYELHDLLAPSSTTDDEQSSTKISPKRNFNVRNIAARFEVRSPGRGVPATTKQQRNNSSAPHDAASSQLDPSNPKPSVQSCRDTLRAREVIQNGLATSQRIAKGNQDIHLYVTMQPVLNGNKFGDKIAVLDMAGLEKEKQRTQSRGKESVASVSQAANAAVLHCLRTMKHNVNILSGESGAIDSIEIADTVDDDISELSSVSLTKKNPTNKHLKTVPFRQHSVTMLLNPFFTKSVGSAKVTLILATYPGHVDITQKRTLLQDIEVLHGSTIGNMNGNTTVKSGLASNKIQHCAIDEESEEEDNLPPKVSIQAQPQPSELHHIVNQVASSSPQKNTLSGLTSPFQALDFPGVNLPVGKTQIQENDGVHRSSPGHKSNQTPLQCRPVQTSLKIQPSSRPHARKTKHSISPRFARAMQLEHETNIINHPSQNDWSQRSQFGDAQNQDRHYQGVDRRLPEQGKPTVETVEIDSRLRILEEKLQKAIEEKKALQQLCAQLEEENADLKLVARESGRKALQNRWTELDEKEFQDSRRLRREDQTLIKAPVRSHLEKVNNIYEIKNQWCMTNKPHFSLQFPNQFQRAEQLNIRDKENKEKEEIEDENLQRETKTASFGEPSVDFDMNLNACPRELHRLAALKRLAKS